MTLMLFTSCSSEEINVLGTQSDNVTASLSQKWIDQLIDDTVYMYCNQTVSYTIGDETKNSYPSATIKLWTEKDSITFGANDAVIPSVGSSTILESNSNSKGKYTKKEFALTDGQKIIAEIMYDIPTITYNDKEVTLPHVIISDIKFLDGRSNQLSVEDKEFIVYLDFQVEWTTSNNMESSTRNPFISYFKIRSSIPDELIKTEYEKGYNWLTETGAAFYVEKTSTWSVSGVKKFKYSSPLVNFSILGHQNKSIEATNLDFNATQNTYESEKEVVSSDEWNIQKSTITKTISFTNGIESFEDNFEYPIYDISYTVDDQTFTFSIHVDVNINYHLTGGGSSATNVTTANLTVYDKTFTSDINTSISKKTTPEEPTPTPNPDPVPETETYNYGKVINYSVTAVFDPSAINTNGEITKKCLCLRFEEGYLWGICEYEEALPETFTYTVSGYSGFNSAAMDKTNSPYEVARAKDINGGIAWYAENNKVIAGIDELTCMAYGWKNIVNGKYSAFVEGYKANYSNDKYTITITAPNGESKKFVSSKAN